MMDAATIARVMGGRVYQGAALVPGPHHSAADRSLRVFPDPTRMADFVSIRSRGTIRLNAEIMCG
jgi:hypothetical protein